MATITIKTPPDGNDLSQNAVDRFLAVLPQGMTPKEGVIRAVKGYVQIREFNLFAQQTSQSSQAAIAQKRVALENDPDVGGPQ